PIMRMTPKVYVVGTCDRGRRRHHRRAHGLDDGRLDRRRDRTHPRRLRARDRRVGRGRAARARRRARALPRWTDRKSRRCRARAAQHAALQRLLRRKLDGAAADGSRDRRPDTPLQVTELLTTRGQGMAKAYASTIVDAPVEAVWDIVRDFNGLPDWIPGVATSEIEDGLDSD